MARLIYRSIIPNDKPEWLLRLQMEIRNLSPALPEREGDEQRFMAELEQMVRDILWEMMDRRGCPRIASDITTDVVTDEGKTVLHIKRNGKVIQTYSLVYY